MPVLTFDKLKQLAADKCPLACEPVPVYEFGPSVVAYVAALGSDERDERVDIPWLEHKEATKQENNVGFRAFLVAACLANSQARDFMAKTTDEISELAAILGKRDGGAVSRLFLKAQKLNGIGEEELSEIEKNLPPCGDGSGTSPSAQGSEAEAPGSELCPAENTKNSRDLLS